MTILFPDILKVKGMDSKNYTKKELKKMLKTTDIVTLSFTIQRPIEWIENKIKDPIKREIIKAKRYAGGIGIPIQVEHILFKDDILAILYYEYFYNNKKLPLTREECVRVIRERLGPITGCGFHYDDERDAVVKLTTLIETLFPELKGG